MKILVTFYSRTGNTRKLAQQIAKNLNADIDEIIDKKDRTGILGWFSGGKDAFFKKQTQIGFIKNPQGYDLVIVGTPVWIGTMTPAIRTYLTQNRLNNVAFFCTFGGKESKTFTEMEKLSGKPIVVLGLKDKKINESNDQIIEFCNKIKEEIKRK